MQVFKCGEKNKSVGSTKMNDQSSCLHAILSITLERKVNTTLRGKEDESKMQGKYNPSSNGACTKKYDAAREERYKKLVKFKRVNGHCRVK